MASKNNTREGIHSGLTQSKSDEKWSDMLNFRCSDNRTFVVPRRLGLLQMDAGLHTVIHGVGDLNYAIGSKKSFLFRGHDDTGFHKLWHARLVRTTGIDDQSENIKLRGSYLGTVPKNIRLTVLKGLLVKDSDWPVEPVVPVEPVYVPGLNCGVEAYYPLVTLFVYDLSTDEGLSAAEVVIYQGVLQINRYYTNANGLISFNLPNNSYTAVVKHVSINNTVTQNFTVNNVNLLVEIGMGFIGCNCSAYTLGQTTPFGVVDPWRGASTREVVSGTVPIPTLNTLEAHDSWYPVVRTYDTFSGVSRITFIVCGISSIEFKCLFDRDPTTTDLYLDFQVNGTSVGLVFPSPGVAPGGVMPTVPPTTGSTSDPEVSGENDNNRKYKSISLTGCTNLITIVAHAGNTDSSGNTMARVDVIDVTAIA